MRFDVVSLFPDMFQALRQEGVVGRALSAGLAQLHLWDLRDFTDDRYRSVDDRPYGGGPGMVMKLAPLRGAIAAAKAAAANQAPVIYLSPQGRRLDQAAVSRMAQLPGLILVAGRYEGIDERLMGTVIDEEWSIGDYVLSGGELAAMVVVDAITRTLPGVLGHADSAQQDSFMTGLLDYPHYTRPEESDLGAVPKVLLSGDHEQIRRWRMKQALGRTWLRRPDLLTGLDLNAEQEKLLDEFVREMRKQDDSEV